MTPTQEIPKLSYFLSEKKGILIVSLIGPLNRSGREVLEACSKDILASGARWVILNFRDVGAEIETFLIPALAQLQKDIRKKPADLRIAGLHPGLRHTLEGRGVLRQQEISNNLAEALQAIAPLLLNAA
jgi:anti-anti-sigma regulatory factor